MIEKAEILNPRGYPKDDKIYASWVDEKTRTGFVCAKCKSKNMIHHGDNCFYCPDCGFASCLNLK